MTHLTRTLQQIDGDIQQVCRQVERSRYLLVLLYVAFLVGIAAWAVWPPAGPVIVFGAVPVLGVLMLAGDARLGRRLARLRAEANAHRGVSA